MSGRQQCKGGGSTATIVGEREPGQASVCQARRGEATEQIYR